MLICAVMENFTGGWQVRSYWGRPNGFEHMVNRNSRSFSGSKERFYGFNLVFNEAIRFLIEGVGSNMINALGGQKFGNVF